MAGSRSHLEIAKSLKRLPPALGGSSLTETWHLVSPIDGSLTLPVGLVSGSTGGHPLPLGSSPGPSQRAAGPAPAGVCTDTLRLPCAVARNSPGPVGEKVAMTSRQGGRPPPPSQDGRTHKSLWCRCTGVTSGIPDCEEARGWVPASNGYPVGSGKIGRTHFKV